MSLDPLTLSMHSFSHNFMVIFVDKSTGTWIKFFDTRRHPCCPFTYCPLLIATSLAEIFRELDCPAAVYFDFNQIALVTISIIIVLAAGL